MVLAAAWNPTIVTGNQRCHALHQHCSTRHDRRLPTDTDLTQITRDNIIPHDRQTDTIRPPSRKPPPSSLANLPIPRGGYTGILSRTGTVTRVTRVEPPTFTVHRLYVRITHWIVDASRPHLMFPSHFGATSVRDPDFPATALRCRVVSRRVVSYRIVSYVRVCVCVCVFVFLCACVRACVYVCVCG